MLAQCARGGQHDNKSLHPVFPCGDYRCFVYFQEKSICFLNQKVIGSQLVLRAPTQSCHLTARGYSTSGHIGTRVYTALKR
jgi:hypothetical protein